MDAGGRATPGAIAERCGEGLFFFFLPLAVIPASEPESSSLLQVGHGNPLDTYGQISLAAAPWLRST
ncbi:MAG: hypothetical protein ACYDCJ_00660 [Gammaproteobacteria bacterium]